MAVTLVSQVLDASAALLNDVNKVTYTYLKQLPYFRIVYDLAQNRLNLLGHPSLGEVSNIQQIEIFVPNPVAPVITTAGTPGATTYGYKIVAIVDDEEQHTIASVEGTIATGNAVLSATNYNVITWEPVAGAGSYIVYRTTEAGAPVTKKLELLYPQFRTPKTLAFDNGGPTTVEVPATTNTAYTKQITILDQFLLIKDVLIEPIKLYERTVGDTDDAWEPMTRTAWEENREPGATFDTWTWRRGVIRLIPSTTIREIKLYYKKAFDAIVDETYLIEHPNFAAFLIYATAGHIAEFVMKDTRRAESLNNLANNAMDVAVGSAVKTMQYLPAKRRPYFFRRER